MLGRLVLTCRSGPSGAPRVGPSALDNCKRHPFTCWQHGRLEQPKNRSPMRRSRRGSALNLKQFLSDLPKQGLERRRGLKSCAFRIDFRAAERDFAEELPKRDRANGPKKRPASRATPERRHVPERVPKVIGKPIVLQAGGGFCLPGSLGVTNGEKTKCAKKTQSFS